jgi:hypothetical protein
VPADCPSPSKTEMVGEAAVILKELLVAEGPPVIAINW